ncbi:MAG: tetratricopeptide repeat protein [Mediterranea sp.]|nr:tetratricopeptide repeat protein [Mediterranea sp.]
MRQLIDEYEAATANGGAPYFDSLQLADIADAYLTQWEFDRAKEVIEYGLKLYPSDIDLMVEEAYLYIDTQQIDKAEEVAKSIIDQSDSEVILLRAELLLHDDEPEEAELLLQEMEDVDDPETIIDVMYLYLDLGYPEYAEAWMRKGEKYANSKSDFKAAQAEYYSATEQLDEAIELFNQLLDEHPHNASYWTGLARSYSRKMETDKAIDACDFALAIDENYGEAYALRAYSYFYLNNPERALSDFMKSMELRSISDEMGYMLIGLTYAMDHEWEKSIEYFEKVIAMMGDTRRDKSLLMDMYNNEAYALGKLGRIDEAMAVSEKAMDIDERYVNNFVTQGKILLMQDREKEAEKTFREAVGLDNGADVWADIGGSYLECNQPEKAKLYYERAYQENPNIESVKEKLCILCLLCHDYDGFFRYSWDSHRIVSREQLQQLLTRTLDREGKEENLSDVIDRLRRDMNEYE